MTTILTAIQLLGGLAMFLYGMEIMGDGLKLCSGAALKNFLGKLTQNTITGLLTGTIVTAIIQSSTATIVLTVGLVGAGILNLRQAASIVMGANIGTTATAQIIRLMDIDSSGNALLTFFKPDTLAPIALIVGIIMVMFIKKGGSKNVGTICMGFGVLFTGLMAMTAAVEPLADSEAFVNAMSFFGDLPMLGIVTGLVLTVIIQSSSAMVGILQALSVTGVMTFELVYPIIMGINLGTCVTTAIVCSIGSSKDAKRTGVVHIVFNTIGTILFMIVMSLLRQAGFFPELWGDVVNSGGIANFQTLFNLVTAIVLVPFTNLLVELACKIVKDEPVPEDKYPELASLDEKLMISPAVALSQVNSALVAMVKAAQENVSKGLEQIRAYDAKRSEEINACEERLDEFTDRAENYLITLSGHAETAQENLELNLMMQCIPNVERIGDYATNFDEMGKKLYDSNSVFSENARKELNILGDAVEEILRLTVEAIETGSEQTARRIEPLEEVIDDMVLLLKNRHTNRLCQGVCVISSGLVFMDALTHLERVADQCSNLAMLVMGRKNQEILKENHRYLQELHEGDDQSYRAEHKMRRAQYLAALDSVEG